MQDLDVEFPLPMLAADGSNWAIYKNQVPEILGWQSLHDHLTNAEMPSSYTNNESVDDATRRWEREETIVRYCITTSLPDSVLFCVYQCTTVKDAWDTLKQRFDRTGRWPRIYLQRELYSKQCGKNEDVRAHFAKLDDLRARLAGWGKSIPNDEYAYILLASLPDVYDTIISVITAAAYVKDPDPSQVVHLVTNEYNQRNLRNREGQTTKNRGSSAAARKRNRKP
jgi:hypothetical protein